MNSMNFNLIIILIKNGLTSSIQGCPTRKVPERIIGGRVKEKGGGRGKGRRRHPDGGR